MRVVVAGGGVGGLAVARAMLNRGHQVRVFERAPGLRSGGGAVTIWPNGTGVLEVLGVDLTGVGQRIDRLEQRRSDGTLMYAIDVAEVSRRLGHRTVTLPRRRLLERLAAALPATTVAYGRACVAVTEHAEGVRLALADGEQAYGDVLIGADGEHSLVRRELVDPGPARSNGWGTWQGLSAVSHDLNGGHAGVTVVGEAGYCGLFPAGEDLLYWWFEVRHQPGTRLPDQPLRYLRDRFRAYATPVPDLLAAVTDEDLAPFWPHVRHRVPRVWGRSKSTLVGDAAHAMPPSLAQGANQTLEDASVLGTILGTNQGPLALSLRRYEQARRRRANLVSRAAAMASAQNANHPLQRLTRLSDTILTAGFTRMLRIMSNSLPALR